VIADLLSFVVGVIAAFAVRVWFVGRRRRRARPKAYGAAYQQQMGERGTPARGVRASLLESVRDPENPNEVTESNERELADDLRGYLGDIGAQHGADDVMFWMRRDEGAPLVGVAWNHRGAPPRQPWGTAHQRELVAWAAAEGVVSFDTAEGDPPLAAARVSLDAVATLPAGGAAAGAIVLHAPAGIRSSRGDLKLWLPRHAERLTQFVEMQFTRNESARQNRRMRALVRSSQNLSAMSTQPELERMVTDDVLDASGATFAALVQWNARTQEGVVRSATQLYPNPAPPAGALVLAASMVGAACVDGVPKHYTETAAIVGNGQLFSATELFPLCGALTIQPMRRGSKIIGAIVIGKQETGAMRQTDLKTTALFAQLAGSALEASWEIAEVQTTARIDQLTGLRNRRHFDDELTRTLDLTDRMGGNCALVLADVDHFKVVNDTYGHEAGDKVLKAIAQVMREQVRTTEASARIGGEEFCVVLQQTGREGAIELAERLRSKVEALAVRWHDRDLRVTWSFGIAIYQAGGGPVKRSQLFEAADRALYRAKGDGRNCVRTA
jgi:diguanylate cyclase (GGDEF)-like protein